VVLTAVLLKCVMLWWRVKSIGVAGRIIISIVSITLGLLPK
jgi:hypothetical protein